MCSICKVFKCILICITFTWTTSSAAIVCSRGSPSFVRTASLSPNVKLRARLRPEPLSAYSCHHHCNREANCYAYFIHFAAKQCYLISSMHASFVRENLEVDDEWDYHQKLCLPVDNCTRHWIFEKITSFQLFAMDEKTLNEVFTEEQCMDACIVEKRFVCRSARYDSTNKKCVLSKYDRRTAAESFKRINNNQIHYFENQCIQDPTKCSFRRLKFARQLNSSHVYILNEKRKRDECERICLNNTDFNCRSYTYDSDTKLCALSPQDSLTIEDTGAISSNRKRSLKQIDSTTIETYEKATCIAVDIRCEANSMTAMITTSGPFRGRLFTLTHPHECYNVGNEQDNLIALSIPLHGRQCGTMNVGNGTFQNSLVIQHHPLILRDSDRRVDVACDYHRIKRKLRGGKQVTESDTVAMTQVITGLVPTPAVSLRVVNSTGAEVRGVELGENLQLKVDMLDQSIFGIFGSDLIARSGEGTESVALIDDRGCPIESAVFPALTRVGRDSKSLTAPFQAFRFTSDAAVKFQMTVSFCLDACEPVNCNDPMIKANKSIDSFGRRRRRRDLTADKYYGSGNTSDDTVTVTSIDELQSGDILRDVTMETTVYVMNNLKPLSYADKRNKLLRKHFSEDSNEHSENSSSTFDCDTANIQFELQSGVLFALQAYKTTRDFQPQECLKVCRQEDACKSLNIDYKKNVCQFLSTSFVDNRMRKENPHFNHFRKICLRTQSACSRHWAFERVRGRELVSVPYGKIHVDAHTLEHCQAACLDFKPFVCRSAEFNYQNSQCKLSPYNRFSSGDKHAKLGVRSYIDYMENNCAHEAKGFCNVKSTKQSRLVLADRFLFTDDVQNCEEECMHNKHFICRSFTYESTTKTCALSHHSKRSYSNGAVIRSATHTFYEVSTCFEVTVDCESDMMNAVIHSNTLFQGKVYTRDRPQSCFVDVGNAMQFSLPIQLSGDECGTITEEEGKFSNVLVIQSNDHVVTAFDKAIGVKCGYDVGNKTGETALHIKELRLTDRSRSSPDLPDLSLHITDTNGHEREVVNLGELLRVQVRMSDEDTYGIFLRNMIAKDETGSNNITLIDQSGCPVEAKLMREVRTVDQQSKSLESYFEAFSFTGSSTLELETEVETCLDKCRPVQCHLVTGRSDDDYEMVSSFGKRKRRNAKDDEKPEKGDVLDSTKLTKTLAVKSQDFGVGINEPNKGPLTAPLSKVSTNNEAGDDDRSNDHKTSKSPFKYVVDEFGYYCFEPTTLATFSGATLLIQGLLFTVALLMATRIKKNKSSSDHSSIIFATKQ